MLKGQAKTDYMREYMRRRRAGQATAKPPKPPKPKPAPPPPPAKTCWFCHAPRSSERMLVGNDGIYICETCVAEAVAVIADAKRASTPQPT
jgi:ClpX C4-type zinc finger